VNWCGLVLQSRDSQIVLMQGVHHAVDLPAQLTGGVGVIPQRYGKLAFVGSALEKPVNDGHYQTDDGTERQNNRASIVQVHL
jgi:hypothetical protein